MVAVAQRLEHAVVVRAMGVRLPSATCGRLGAMANTVTIPDSWPKRWDKLYDAALDAAEYVQSARGRWGVFIMVAPGNNVHVSASRVTAKTEQVKADRRFKGSLKPEHAFAIGAAVHEETGQPVDVYIMTGAATLVKSRSGSVRSKRRSGHHGLASFRKGRVKEIWLQ